MLSFRFRSTKFVKLMLDLDKLSILQNVISFLLLPNVFISFSYFVERNCAALATFLCAYLFSNYLDLYNRYSPSWPKAFDFQREKILRFSVKGATWAENGGVVMLWSDLTGGRGQAVGSDGRWASRSHRSPPLNHSPCHFPLNYSSPAGPGTLPKFWGAPIRRELAPTAPGQHAWCSNFWSLSYRFDMPFDIPTPLFPASCPNTSNYFQMQSWFRVFARGMLVYTLFPFLWAFPEWT